MNGKMGVFHPSHVLIPGRMRSGGTVGDRLSYIDEIKLFFLGYSYKVFCFVFCGKQWLEYTITKFRLRTWYFTDI